MPEEGNEEVFEGVCHIFSETGTEGGLWAFQDNRHIANKGKENEAWSYRGLHILEDGDFLTIYSPDSPEKVIWSGFISLQPRTSFDWHVFGIRVHSYPIGIDKETWGRYFLKEYPAKLIKAKKKNG